MKIMLVEDHAVVRAGLRRLLAGAIATSLVEVENGRQALPLYRAERPDLVILDLNLAGMTGLELIRRLILDDGKVRILVFSMHTEALYAARAMAMGAKGYVSKSASAEELLEAVGRVAAGATHVEREIAAELDEAQPAEGDPLRHLTHREVEMVRLLGEGRSLNGIAEAMGISYKTAANSCGRIKEKLMCRRTADLILLARDIRRS